MTAELLQLRKRAGGAPLERCGDAFVLEAEEHLVLEGPKAEIDEIAKTLGSIAERFRDDLLALEFGNAVGVFNLPGLGRVEVHSGKWGPDHFRQMLSDLSIVASALPFRGTATAALPFDRSVLAETDVLYHAFVYLRYAILEGEGDDNLLRSYLFVMQEPHQILVRQDRSVPTELATRVGPRSLLSLVCRGHQLAPAGFARKLPIARALRGYVARRVDEEIIRRSYDTAENRFAKAFLDQVTWVVAQMQQKAESISGADRFAERVRQECKEITRQLRPLRADALWEQVGSMVTVPISSQVLQYRRGYREILRHFSLLRLAARIPLDRDLSEKLLEAKDIATLYELWCFFTMVEAMRGQLGSPSESDAVACDATQKSVQHGYRVAWASGVALTYNAAFSRSAGPKRRSFSVALRPDIALELPRGPNEGLHLFDAKFKMDPIGEVQSAEPDESWEDPDAPTRAGFKRGDLYKMHTYRDAIPEARSVWILYPGSETRFFSMEGPTVVQKMEDLPTHLDGVGAVPLRPEAGGTAELRSLLGSMIRP